jgi:ABC transporter substrate binding protein
MRKRGQSAQRSSRSCGSWAGRTAAICGPTLAGRTPPTRSRCIDSRRNSSRCSLISSFRTIPIIFGIVADPIGSGFVVSFPRPGFNATGFAVTEPTQAGKWVELLKEIAPRVTRVAALFNPAMATFAEFWLKPFKAAAALFAVEAILAPVHDTSELDSVIAAQAREPNTGLFVMPDAFTITYRVEITSLAARRSPCRLCIPFFSLKSAAKPRSSSS